ncbi:MAG: hypothetical protein AAFY06_13595 [Pseudomonadota bacterium]
MAFDPLTVLASEQGVVRVFTGDLLEDGDVTPKTAQGLLGEGIELDASKVEVFPPSAIQPVGMAAYLAEGHGIAESDLDEDALDALTGLVIVVPSSAFLGREVNLSLNQGVRLVGAYREPRAAPPRSMAEPGRIEAPLAFPAPDASSPRFSWVWLVLALILVALVLWAVF